MVDELRPRTRALSRKVRKRRTIVVASAVGVAILLTVVIVSIVNAAGGGPVPAVSSPPPSVSPSPTPDPIPTPTPTPTPTFDRSAQSIDDPMSYWVVVNKLRALNPADFTPPDLVEVPVPHTWSPLMRQTASDAIVTMFAAAQSEAGLSLASNSAYRSYSTQVDIYDGNDMLTARPGHSEHQTGLTMDIGAQSGNCSLSECFADTAEGQWLAANAWRFGFLLRYPADKIPVTGYSFEPWHYRYIGVELSTEMHNTGVTTLEEFFGLPAAPDYAG